MRHGPARSPAGTVTFYNNIMQCISQVGYEGLANFCAGTVALSDYNSFGAADSQQLMALAPASARAGSRNSIRSPGGARRQGTAIQRGRSPRKPHWTGRPQVFSFSILTCAGADGLAALRPARVRISAHGAAVLRRLDEFRTCSQGGFHSR